MTNLHSFRFGIAFTVLYAFGLSVQAQETEEPNIDYEHLQVLVPMIGTWHTTGESSEGVKYELLVRIDWSNSKRSLVTEISRKTGETIEELAGKEWEVIGHQFNVWNRDKNRIEIYAVRPDRGRIRGYGLESTEGGEFNYSLFLDAGSDGRTSDRTIIVTGRTLKDLYTNRKDADGKLRENLELIYHRKN